jgi:hypothetical protein
LGRARTGTSQYSIGSCGSNAPKDAVPYFDYMSLHALGLDAYKQPDVFDDPKERERAFDWARLR